MSILSPPSSAAGAAYSVSLSWAPYLSNTTFRLGQSHLSQVSWSHNENFTLFKEEEFASHHLLKFSRVGSTKLMESFLSEATRNGSVGAYISQSETLISSEDKEDLLLQGELYTTQMNRFISIVVHIDSQPNEFWAATNMDACVPSLNESFATCDEWLEIIRSPLILYECYFQESDSGPKVRQIPYASLNNDAVAPTGFVTFHREVLSNYTDSGEISHGYAKENAERNNALIPSFITIAVLATVAIVAIVKMWPTSRRGYEVVP